MISTTARFRDFQHLMTINGVGVDEDIVRDARYLWWALGECRAREAAPEWLDVLDYGKHGCAFLHALLIHRLAPCNVQYTKRKDQIANASMTDLMIGDTPFPASRDKPTTYNAAWLALRCSGIPDFTVAEITRMDNHKSHLEPVTEGPHDVILIDMGKRSRDIDLVSVLKGMFEMCVTPATVLFVRHGNSRRKLKAIGAYSSHYIFESVPETTIAVGRARLLRM